MDQQSQKSIPQIKAKQAQRAYGCPCGKNYLSYPALFTHVKQKHQGKAPGKLIKPKTGKIRGRPKTRVSPQELELLDIINRIQHDIPGLVEQYPIQYDFGFERSEGSTTCQDAASAFIDHFQNLGENGISENGISVLACFLNELKNAVQKKYGVDYWIKQKPAQIIEVANILYARHEQSQDTFPISNQVFKELIYNFFEWLYANKFTDHRLLKRIVSQEDGVKTNQ